MGGTEDPQVLLPLSKPVVFALAKKSMAAAAALAVIRSPQVPIQCLAGKWNLLESCRDRGGGEGEGEGEG